MGFYLPEKDTGPLYSPEYAASLVKNARDGMTWSYCVVWDSNGWCPERRMGSMYTASAKDESHWREWYREAARSGTLCESFIDEPHHQYREEFLDAGNEIGDMMTEFERAIVALCNTMWLR